MRPIRVSFTVRGLLIAVALVGLNLAAAVMIAQHRPPCTLPAGGSHFDPEPDKTIFTQEDGSRISYLHLGVGVGGRIYDRPKVTDPPRPTLLRVCSPILISVAISLSALYAAVSRKQLPRMTMRRWALLLAAAAIAVWLAMPLIWIASNPDEDYHTHKHEGVIRIAIPMPGYRPSVHANPFWPRYGRLLLGRPWPGDYRCTVSPESSLPLPPGTPLEIRY